jgi:hypothetical protein
MMGKKGGFAGAVENSGGCPGVACQTFIIYESVDRPDAGVCFVGGTGIELGDPSRFRQEAPGPGCWGAVPFAPYCGDTQSGPIRVEGAQAAYRD